MEIYHLVNQQFATLNIAVEIVSFAHQNGGSFQFVMLKAQGVLGMISFHNPAGKSLILINQPVSSSNNLSSGYEGAIKGALGRGIHIPFRYSLFNGEIATD